MSATAYHYTDIWKTQTPNYRYDSNNNKAIKHLITGMTQSHGQFTKSILH
jgi:hypothetical protein